MKTAILISLIVGVLIGVFISRDIHCGKERGQITTTHDTTVLITLKDTTIYRDTGSIKSVPYAVYLPAKIDTPAAIIDYYTFKSVQDSFIQEDTKVFIDDTLYKNSLFARKARIQTTRRDSIIHTTTTIRKSADGLYLGLQTNLKDVAPSVLYLKGRSAYGVGYSLQQQNINLSYYYKFFGK